MNKKKKNQKTARLILIKIPLALWILFAVIATWCSSGGLHEFLAVLLTTGVFIGAWTIICDFIINNWDLN